MVVKVIDIFNFEGSFVNEIIDMCAKKHTRLILVVNKCDTLPRGVKKDRLFKWAKERVDFMLKEIGHEGMKYNLFTISSKS